MDASVTAGCRSSPILFKGRAKLLPTWRADVMTIPSFTAEASLYTTPNRYATRASSNSDNRVVVAQLSNVGIAPWSWCRLACLLCRYYGYACWPCFICAIYPGGGLSNSPGGGIVSPD